MVVLPSAVRFLAATMIAAVSFIKAVDGCTQLQVNVKTDDYPEETSWQLVDTCTGNTVASRSYFAAKNTQYSNSYCLPSRYQFTIKDSYGDGLCCGYGYGSYSVVWDGVVKVSGGYFGFSQTTTFGSCPTPPPTAHVSLCSSLISCTCDIFHLLTHHGNGTFALSRFPLASPPRLQQLPQRVTHQIVQVSLMYQAYRLVYTYQTYLCT